MQIQQDNWPVTRLVRDQKKINLNPTWQRGPAWKPPRQVLLIDSILRGMDIPKVYLRRLPVGGVFQFDAVDGQQRLRSIWMFRSGELALDHAEPLPSIDKHSVSGLTYNALPKPLRDRFDNFEVSIAEITSATTDEITNLFSRLQLGVSLNPAELRNAMLVPMRQMAVSLEEHEFFQESRISAARYKRQDFVTHALAMAAYQGDRDIKAINLKQMLLEFGNQKANDVLRCAQEVGDALNVLSEVNRLVRFRITQKWVFVDLCWLIMQRHAAGVEVDPTKIAARYTNFEERRMEYGSRPGDLLKGPGAQDRLNKQMYNYITAFRSQGGQQANLIARNVAVRAYFRNIDRRI